MTFDTSEEVFNHVFNAFVGTKCGSIFIAGGAPVDLEKAGDIDLWIGMNNEDLAHNTVCKLPYRVFGKGGNYDGGAIETKFVGQGYVPTINKIVQVIVHPFKNAEELMDTFDISTHQRAFNSLGKYVESPSYTPWEVPPKILKWRAKTMERYIKICGRYCHDVDLKVLEQYNDSSQPPIIIKPKKSKYLNIPDDDDDDIPF